MERKKLLRSVVAVLCKEKMNMKTRNILKGVLAFSMAILMFMTAIPTTLQAEDSLEENKVLANVTYSGTWAEVKLESGASIMTNPANGTFGEPPAYLKGLYFIQKQNLTPLTATVTEDCYAYILADENLAATLEAAEFSKVQAYTKAELWASGFHLNNHSTIPNNLALWEKQVEEGDTITCSTGWSILMTSRKQLTIPLVEVKSYSGTWAEVKLESGASIMTNPANGTFGEPPAYLKGLNFIQKQNLTPLTATVTADCYAYILADENLAATLETAGFTQVQTYTKAELWTSGFHLNNHSTIPNNLALWEKQVEAGDTITCSTGWSILMASRKQLTIPLVEVKSYSGTWAEVKLESGASIMTNPANGTFGEPPAYLKGLNFIQKQNLTPLTATVSADCYAYILADENLAATLKEAGFTQVQTYTKKELWTSGHHLNNHSTIPNNLALWEKQVVKGDTITYGGGWAILMASRNQLQTTVPSQWDGYKIVTPATFGLADIVSDSVYDQETATGSGKTAATPATNVGTYNIDKTVFQADVRHETHVKSYLGSNFGYLYSTEQTQQLVIYLTNTANQLKIRNLRETGDTNLYVGGQFVGSENGKVYKQGDYEPVAWQKDLIIEHTTAVGKTFHLRGYTLWISTEFVEFDGDGNKDDLQIGFWINGKLYNNTYCYYVDYHETVCSSYLSVTKMDTMVSPNVEPDDLGLASGEYSANENMVIGSSAVATGKAMSGTTMETDVLFDGVGASLLYGCNDEDTPKAFKFTSTADGIQVSHTYNDTEEQIALLTKDMFGTELVNKKFHLKLTTDVVNNDGGTEADDVSLRIQIGDKKYVYVVANVAPQLTGRMGVECKGDATVVVGTYASDTVEEVYHCLEEGTYIAEGATRLLVDGTVVANPSEPLNEPGIYNLVLTQNRLIHRQKVVLYNRYDVNEDQDVNVKDLVRMLKVADDTTQDSEIAELGEAGKLAIAYEGADKWTNDNAVHVVDFMRENLAGTQAEAKQTGTVTTIDATNLEQFANKHGAFTGNFTFTLDLENIDRVDNDFYDKTDEIWILSTYAKYISVDGSYPTIQFRLINEAGSELYTSHTYKVGEKNGYVERQWRVPMTLEDYTKLEVNFVVPDGVALYIETLKDLDNVKGEISAEDETVYAEDDGIKYLAHTGLAKYAPGNTLMSFEAAGKMGFKSLITIPKFTKDGVGVCLHDDQIYMTLRNKDGSAITDKTLEIQNLNYDELSNYVAGIHKGKTFSSPVPTLEQFFDICMKYRMEPVFSIHPALTVEEWTYVKNMLHQDKYKDENGDYWLYERLQVKAGVPTMLDPAIEVMGFEIGGYILIQSTAFGWINHLDVFVKVKAKAREAGLSNVFDKVSVEFIDYSDHASDTVEDKIRFAKACGFTRISLYSGGAAEEFGFSSEKQRYFVELGVNSFTVDFHCSMGLNW